MASFGGKGTRAGRTLTMLVTGLGLSCGGQASDRSGAEGTPAPTAAMDDPVEVNVGRSTQPRDPAGRGERSVDRRAPTLPRDDASPEPPPVDEGDLGDEGDELVETGIRGAAGNILQSTCGQCHAGSPTALNENAAGPAYGVIDSLFEAGLLVFCASERSPIIERMTDGSMPPEGYEGPRPNEQDIETVAEYVDLQCTPEELACAAEPAGSGCGIVRVEQVLNSHCEACHGDRARGRSDVGGSSDGPIYLNDVRQMIVNGQVIPCDSAASPLLQRVDDGSMPPGPNIPQDRYLGVARLGVATRAVIADFIDGLCAPPEPASAEATERAAVEQVLGAACGECHGASSPVSDAARDGFHGVDDVDSMIRSGHVIPCDVESSILLRRLRDGSMPPPGSRRPALEAEDIERVAAVVDAPCRR